MSKFSVLDCKRRPLLEPDEKAFLLTAIDDIRKHIDKDELATFAYVATSADGENVYQCHAGSHNDPYRLVGSLESMKALLLHIHHVEPSLQ